MKDRTDDLSLAAAYCENAAKDLEQAYGLLATMGRFADSQLEVAAAKAFLPSVGRVGEQAHAVAVELRDASRAVDLSLQEGRAGTGA